jgi:hypothetical protein
MKPPGVFWAICLILFILVVAWWSPWQVSATDTRGSLAQELDTGKVTVETVWRRGTDVVVLITDNETGTRCYAAYGSLACISRSETK